MANPTQDSEVFCQLTSKAVEAFSLWADTGQRVLRELMDLSTSMAKEGVGLYSQIQSSTVDAVKDSQNYFLCRSGGAQDGPRNALSCYQKNMLESVEVTQKAFRLFDGNAQAVTRSAERLQMTAERSAKEIQNAFAQLSGKVRSLYSPIG
jgi:hypothetical protein